MEWEVCAFCGISVYEDEGYRPEYSGYLCEDCYKMFMLYETFQRQCSSNKKEDKNEVQCT